MYKNSLSTSLWSITLIQLNLNIDFTRISYLFFTFFGTMVSNGLSINSWLQNMPWQFSQKENDNIRILFTFEGWPNSKGIAVYVICRQKCVHTPSMSDGNSRCEWQHEPHSSKYTFQHTPRGGSVHWVGIKPQKNTHPQVEFLYTTHRQ